MFRPEDITPERMLRALRWAPFLSLAVPGLGHVVLVRWSAFLWLSAFIYVDFAISAGWWPLLHLAAFLHALAVAHQLRRSVRTIYPLAGG